MGSNPVLAICKTPIWVGPSKESFFGLFLLSYALVLFLFVGTPENAGFM